MSLQWTQPTLDGGCDVLGFKLFRNDGAGGTTFTEIDAATINDKPTYTEHTTSSFPASPTGKTFVFKL